METHMSDRHLHGHMQQAFLNIFRRSCEGLGGSEEAAPAGNEVRRRSPLQDAETHLEGGVQEEQEEEMVAECAAVSQMEP